MLVYNEISINKSIHFILVGYINFVHTKHCFILFISFMIDPYFVWNRKVYHSVPELKLWQLKVAVLLYTIHYWVQNHNKYYLIWWFLDTTLRKKFTVFILKCQFLFYQKHKKSKSIESNYDHWMKISSYEYKDGTKKSKLSW